MVVVIARGAATGDDDGDWDINSANVGLAVIRQTIAFLFKASVKKRWPAKHQVRVHSSLQSHNVSASVGAGDFG